MTRSDRRKWIARAIVGVLTGALWYLTVVRTGFTTAELSMFAGPGLVLTLAASWCSRVFHRDEWTWAAGLRAAAAGGLVAPPLIAFGLAFLSAMNHDALPLIFILGAWLSIAGGVFVACIRALRDDFRKRKPSARARLVVHRRSVARGKTGQPVLRIPTDDKHAWF